MPHVRSLILAPTNRNFGEPYWPKILLIVTLYVYNFVHRSMEEVLKKATFRLHRKAENTHIWQRGVTFFTSIVQSLLRNWGWIILRGRQLSFLLRYRIILWDASSSLTLVMFSCTLLCIHNTFLQMLPSLHLVDATMPINGGCFHISLLYFWMVSYISSPSW
jgi:hypothetical protein